MALLVLSASLDDLVPFGLRARFRTKLIAPMSAHFDAVRQQDPGGTTSGTESKIWRWQKSGLGWIIREGPPQRGSCSPTPLPRATRVRERHDVQAAPVEVGRA